MTRINIALGFTRDWVLYAATTVTSILSNAAADDSYYFYLMSDGFSDKEKNVFYNLNKIQKSEFNFIIMDNSEFDGAIHDWLGVSSSYRLKLSSLVNEDKILYVDSDIMALEDVKSLYSYDVSKYYVAMIEDKCGFYMRRSVGLKDNEIYFNGGVQLINLKKFREDELEQKIFDKLRKCDFYTDQDVINDVCRGKILSLPLKYNIVPHAINHYKSRENERDEAIKHPVLVHFTHKSWGVGEYSEDWLKYNNIATENGSISL